jgi:hypothetical protein
MKIQLEDLVKSHAGLAAHFGKAAGFHAAAHGVHAAHAEFAKAAGEAMDDNDEHKQYFTKSAKAHEDLAELHKGMGEHCAGMAAGMQTKAAVVDPNDKDAVAKAAKEAEDARIAAEAAGNAAPGSQLEKMMTETVARVTEQALKAFESDPAIAKRIQEGVLERVNAVLGSTIVPTKAKGAFMTEPMLIRRPGQPNPTAAEVEKVDPALQDMVSAS